MARDRQELEGMVGFEDEETLSISVRLQKVTDELKKIRDSLTLAKDVDPSILTDFRDAVNRVRNTAWAVEQYLNSKTTEGDPQIVLTFLRAHLSASPNTGRNRARSAPHSLSTS